MKAISKTELRRLAVIGAISVGALVLSGCAGDMKYARNAAKKANSFVGDMQRTTANAIQAQRGAYQGDQSQVAELKALAEIRKASSGRHVATWQGDDTEDSLEIYQAMVELTKDDDLTRTAPFVIMTPLPEFNAPAVNDKSFTDLMAKLNKLSQRLSPMDRVNALIPFVKGAVKAYGDSAKAAAEEAKELKAQEPSTGSSLVRAQQINIESLLKSPQNKSIQRSNATDPFLSRSKTQPDSSFRLKSMLPNEAATAPETAEVPNPAPVESLMNALQ